MQNTVILPTARNNFQLSLKMDINKIHLKFYFSLDIYSNVCYFYYINRSTTDVATTIVDTTDVRKERLT